jgi:hypothetical protein
MLLGIAPESWFNIGFGIACLLAGLLGGWGWKGKVDKKGEEKEKEEASISKSDYQTRHSNVHDLLTTLRVETGATRAKIGHFHNGGKFLDGSPMKKFSITHESCVRGVPYDGPQLQNIHVTLFWDMVESMRDNDGILHKTEGMRDGYFRSYNKSNDTVAYSILPIIKQDLYIGFIMLEWFDEQVPPFTDPSFVSTFRQMRDYIELELALR